MPVFVDAKNLQPYISKDLMQLIKPTIYIDLKGKENQGYDATMLPLLCDVYLEARIKGAVLTKSQEPLAQQAEILVRSLSKIGIIALVDEATSYQYDRAKDELQIILKAYIIK